MVGPLPAGCRLTAVYDCCHSGSALDLPYEYVHSQLFALVLTSRATMDYWKNRIFSVKPNGAFWLLHKHMPNTTSVVSSALDNLSSKFWQQHLKPENKSVERKHHQPMSSKWVDVRIMRLPPILQKGFVLYQTTLIGQGLPTGAMSWAFREVLTRQPRQSYNSLLVNIRNLLATKYQQKPVLSSSHPIDTQLEFIIWESGKLNARTRIIWLK